MRHLAGFLAILALAGAPAAASDCTRTTTGLTPLDQLGPALYRGFPGGLYPGGTNRRPAAHEDAGLRLAAEVVPRNAAGDPDPAQGRIVLLSIGMSNATQEFQAFLSAAGRDAHKNPQVTIVDGAQGGWTAARIASTGDQYWSTVDQRLRAAGVAAAQVQAAWMKEADSGPTQPFPDHARLLQREMANVAKELRSRFPNLKLLYLSSRIYGGYASTALNPEPYAYESGFAVQWLIAQQIAGDPDLSHAAGRAPWMAWGPYLWADGTAPRGDGLSWACSDLQPSDGTHPADPARQKVARMLLDFFKTDSTTRSWFLRPAPAGVRAPSPAVVLSAASYAAAVAPGSLATVWGSELASGAAEKALLPLPLWLNGAGVEMDGFPCGLYYVSPAQINFRIPPEARAGRLTVVRDGVASAAVTVPLSGNAPAVFMRDAAGTAAALHPDYRQVTAQEPAAPGEIVAFFGTGFGANPQATIGGVPARIDYAGPVPLLPGVDQINVEVPANTPRGGVVQVVLRVGDAAANPVTIAVR